MVHEYVLLVSLTSARQLNEN